MENTMNFKKKNEKEKKPYNLSFDNLAIPEIHTHPSEETSATDQDDDQSYVHYDTVAIPEVHIRKKKK